MNLNWTLGHHFVKPFEIPTKTSAFWIIRFFSSQDCNFSFGSMLWNGTILNDHRKVWILHGSIPDPHCNLNGSVNQLFGTEGIWRRPFEIRKHLKTGLFEYWLSNGLESSSHGGLEVERRLSFNTWAALCFGGSNPAWGRICLPTQSYIVVTPSRWTIQSRAASSVV